MRLIVLFILVSSFTILRAQHLIPFNKNGKYGLCDINGNIKVEPQYNYLSFFNEKVKGYSIESEGLFGLMGVNLQVVIPPMADQPIFASGDHLIVKKGNELIYYDNDYKEVERRELNPVGQESGLVYPAEYPSQLGYTREEVLELFKEKYGNVYKSVRLNVFSANSAYFQIESLSEGKRKNEGLFLPKTKTLLRNDEQISYQSAVWIPSKNCYYISITQAGNNKGIITEAGQTVFEPKQYTYLAVMPQFIAYTESETAAKTIAYYYIIHSGKSLKNEFSNFRHSTTLSNQGKEFEVFTAVIENPDLHQTEQVYIGENGMKYYDLDFVK